MVYKEKNNNILHISVSKDRGRVYIISNCLEDNDAIKMGFVQRKSYDNEPQNADRKVKVAAPLATVIYNIGKSFVDTSNQRKQCLMTPKFRRKNMRTCFDILIRVVFINSMILAIDMEWKNLWDTDKKHPRIQNWVLDAALTTKNRYIDLISKHNNNENEDEHEHNNDNHINDIDIQTNIINSNETNNINNNVIPNQSIHCESDKENESISINQNNNQNEIEFEFHSSDEDVLQDIGVPYNRNYFNNTINHNVNNINDNESQFDDMMMMENNDNNENNNDNNNDNNTENNNENNNDNQLIPKLISPKRIGKKCRILETQKVKTNGKQHLYTLIGKDKNNNSIRFYCKQCKKRKTVYCCDCCQMHDTVHTDEYNKIPICNRKECWEELPFHKIKNYKYIKPTQKRKKMKDGDKSYLSRSPRKKRRTK